MDKGLGHGVKTRELKLDTEHRTLDSSLWSELSKELHYPEALGSYE